MEEEEEMIFETTRGVAVVDSFEKMGLKEDLLRGIYSYGMCLVK